MATMVIPELLHQAQGPCAVYTTRIGTSLLLALRVWELVLVVQEQYEQVPVLPRHPWVARVAKV